MTDTHLGFSPTPLPKILITPSKVRAARAALNWTQRELMEAAGVGHGSIVHYETGARSMQRASLRAIQKAFEDAGVKFTSTGIEWFDGPTRVQAAAVLERPTPPLAM